MRVKIRKLSSFAALIFLCAFMVQPSAFATVTQLASDSETDIAIRDVATVIGDNSVCYPQLEGMADTALQQQINDTIVNDANIAQRLAVLSTLQAGGKGLQVTYTAYLDNRLFSVVIIAKGMLEAYRSEQEYTALCFDLSSGARLTLADLFIDPDAAVAWMERSLQTVMSTSCPPIWNTRMLHRFRLIASSLIKMALPSIIRTINLPCSAGMPVPYSFTTASCRII